VGVADVVIAAIVLAGAGALLVRSVRRGGKHCGGCAGGGCQRPPDPVKIGGRRAAAAGERPGSPGCA
jgi:hypothetical protein